jgi:host factor-I protein
VARVKSAEQADKMKDATESMPAERILETEDFGNRKLIRPSLNHTYAPVPVVERRDGPQRNDRPERHDRNGSVRKPAPLEQTNAENFYYQKQMQAKTPMVIVLRDGEKIHGVIEWYDRNSLKINRTGEPNLMVYKPAIKYMYKEAENGK